MCDTPDAYVGHDLFIHVTGSRGMAHQSWVCRRSSSLPQASVCACVCERESGCVCDREGVSVCVFLHILSHTHTNAHGFADAAALFHKHVCV